MDNIHRPTCNNCFYGGPSKNVCDKGTPLWDDSVYWCYSCDDFKNRNIIKIRLEKFKRLMKC
jgi:hypothetical protein